MVKVKSIIMRNKITMSGARVAKGVVLEQWSERENIGDYISKVIFEWILNKNGLNASEGKNTHLFAIGSIIGGSKADGVLWGTGILKADSIMTMYRRSLYVNYDIRALRGPITRDFMKAAGYNCDNIALADPGILMPLVLPKITKEKKYEYCVINHYVNEKKNKEIEQDCITITAGTNDYRDFINTICESRIVISSSLHGIILAESYGIPAIWLLENMEDRTLKYYDYYYSTQRYNIPVARSVEEAKEIRPIELPTNIAEMQIELLNAFPFDLWEKRT